MQKVRLEEAKAKLELLFEAAINGETVLIEQEGSIVQLTLLSHQIEPTPRQFGSGANGILYMSDDFDEPLEDFREYME